MIERNNLTFEVLLSLETDKTNDYMGSENLVTDRVLVASPLCTIYFL